MTIHCLHPNLILFNVILLDNPTKTKAPKQILVHFNILPTYKSGRVKQRRGKNVTCTTLIQNTARRSLILGLNILIVFYRG